MSGKNEFFAELLQDPAQLIFKQCQDQFGEAEIDLVQDYQSLCDDTIIKEIIDKDKDEKEVITWKQIKHWAMQPDYQQNQELIKFLNPNDDKAKLRPETKRIINKLVKAQNLHGPGPLNKNQTTFEKFDANFDLRDLAESGQCSLLEKSEKYGALFLAFNTHLIVLQNSQIYEMTQEGVLPPLTDITVINFADLGARNPIIFMRICDKLNKLFIQCENEDLRVFQTEALLQKKSNIQKSMPEFEMIALENQVRGKVRQVSTMAKCLANGSTQQYATVVLQTPDDKYVLHLVDLAQKKTIGRKENVTTAVFNIAEDAIVAGLDTQENGLAILDIPTLQEQLKINLTFPDLHEDIAVDKYRLFWIAEANSNNYVMFAAYYDDEESLEDNIGKTLMIWVGKDLNKNSSLQELKDSKKVKTFFWGDTDHQNDEKIPSFSVQWLLNPKDKSLQWGMAMQNHADHPYYFLVKDGDLSDCCEFTGMTCPNISRPKCKDGEDMMSAQDTLGACLGFTLLQSKLRGAPDLINITLHEEEEIPQPPVMFLYSLDGKIKMYHSFISDWKEDDLLRQPEEVKAMPVLIKPSQERPRILQPSLEQPKIPPFVERNQNQPQQNLQLSANNNKTNEEAKKQNLEENKIGEQKSGFTGFNQMNNLFQQDKQPPKPASGPMDPFKQPGMIPENKTLQNNQNQSSFSGLMNNLNLGAVASEEEKAELEPLNKSLSWKMPKQPQTNDQKAFIQNIEEQKANFVEDKKEANFGQQVPKPSFQSNFGQNMSQGQPQFKPMTQNQNQNQPRQKTQEEIRNEIRNQMKPDQKLAIEVDQVFSNLYNEKVVAKMNKIKAMLPDSFSQDLLDIRAIADCQEYSQDHLKIKDHVKKSIDETQIAQINLKSSQNLIDVLKREMRYGIHGDPEASKTSIKDIAKLTGTVEDFLRRSEYEEDDKELLKDIFTQGDDLVQQYDMVYRRIQFQQKVIQGKKNKLNACLSEDERRRREGQPPLWTKAQENQRQSKLRQNLLRNAGCYREENDINHLSMQISIQENMKQLENEITNIQSKFKQLQDQEIILHSTDNISKKSKTSRLGPDDSQILERTPWSIHENETKEIHDHYQKKENLQRVIRNPKMQRELQRKLMEQMTEAKEVKVINSIAAQPVQKVVEPAKPQSLATKQFEKKMQTIKIGGNEEEKKQNQNIMAFFNSVNDPAERKQFISTLDQQLITSPNLSPTPPKDSLKMKPLLPNDNPMLKQKVQIKVDLGNPKLDLGSEMKQSNSNAVPKRFDSKNMHSRVSLGSAVSFGDKEKLNKISEATGEESKINLAFDVSASDNSVSEDPKINNEDINGVLKQNPLQKSLKNAIGSSGENFEVMRTKTQSFGNKELRPGVPGIKIAKLGTLEDTPKQQDSIQTEGQKKPSPLFPFKQEEGKTDTLGMISESNPSVVSKTEEENAGKTPAFNSGLQTGTKGTGLFGSKKESETKKNEPGLFGSQKIPEKSDGGFSILGQKIAPASQKPNPSTIQPFGTSSGTNENKTNENNALSRTTTLFSGVQQPGANGMGGFLQTAKTSTTFGAMDMNAIAKKEPATQKFGSLTQPQKPATFSSGSQQNPNQTLAFAQNTQQQPLSFSSGAPQTGQTLKFGNPSGNAGGPATFAAFSNPNSKPGGMFGQTNNQPSGGLFSSQNNKPGGIFSQPMGQNPMGSGGFTGFSAQGSGGSMSSSMGFTKPRK